MRLAPTRSGTAALLAVPILAVLGRVFGLVELFVVATALAAALIAATLGVRLRRPSLEVRRVARPCRLPCGATAHVHLSITNTGRRSPVLTVRDHVAGIGDARLCVAPLRRGATWEARYELPTSRRGVLAIGPLHVELEDAFAFVRGRFRVDHTTSLVVLPRIHTLTPLPPATADAGELTMSSYRSRSSVDEEFVGLRDYVEGDDVRRIHWASTARRRRPVVRQYDRPWERRTTVVLDLRATNHDAESFERSVSAAASVLAAGIEHGEAVRLTTSGGFDSGFVAGSGALDDLLDHLAEVQPRHGGRLDGAYRLLGRRGTGNLVSCLGTFEADDIETVTAVPAGRHVAIVARGTPPTRSGRVRVVLDDGSDRLADAWHRSLTTAAAS